MTLPTVSGREDPIYKPATKPCSDPAHGACFILIHGLGDSAEGLEGESGRFWDRNDSADLNRRGRSVPVYGKAGVPELDHSQCEGESRCDADRLVPTD